MSFKRLAGQKDIKIRLRHEYMGDPHHAFLFTGAEGSGRHEFSREFSKALLCSSPNEDGACGNCDNCRYFDAGTHPDFICLFDINGKNIKVEDVRSRIVSDIRIGSQISKRKVYLIEGGELNEAGQNALLKSLEEPPSDVIFIIICKDAQELLPTVLSRTVEYKLRNYEKDDIMSVLRKKNEEKFEGKFKEDELEFICEFSSGSIGKAVDLLGDEELPVMREKMLELITNIGKDSYTTILNERYSYFTENADNIRELMLFLLWILGDLAVLRKDRDSNLIKNSDRKDVLVGFLNDNPSVDLNRIYKASGHVNTVFKRIELNVNHLYVIGDLLLGLKKEFKND